MQTTGSRNGTGTAAVLAALLAVAADSGAEAPPAVGKAAAAPVIDGRLGADEWANALTIRDLHQVEPVEYALPSEDTVWFLQADDSSLYVAAHAADRQPALIVAQKLRQGASVNSDDSLHLLLDPFNNRRSGYAFALNPNGVRFDGIYTNGTRLSSDWDGIWRGQARRTADGWTMEMAIPFSSLAFEPGRDTWGVNLWREIPRNDELIAWRSRNGQVDPTVSGELAGFAGAAQGHGLDVIPSLSTTWLRDRARERSDDDLNPSLDINYRPGSAFNALLTINTDFAATEVDDRQLGLRRFSLFFPEKRSFFLTDFDIFEFGGVPGSGGDDGEIGFASGTNGLAFFSRRIGLSDDREPVDIHYGGKLSGRSGRWDFGTLYVRQDASGDVAESDLLVARVTRGLLRESTLGAIATYGDPTSNDDNSLVGADFLYRNTRLNGTRSVTGQAWVQRSDNARVDGRDLAYSASLSFPASVGFEFGAQYHVVQERFRPPLGFANRVGVRLASVAVGHNRVRSGPVQIREVSHALSLERWEFLDTGRVQTQELDVDYLTLRTPAGDRLRLTFTANQEGLLDGEQPLDDIGIVVPGGDFRFNRHAISLRSAGHRPLSGRLDLRFGDFLNGERTRIRPELEWVPNRHLRFAVEYDYNRYDFPEASAVTREVTVRNGIAFNSALSLQTLAQYDNVSDDIGLNMRFRYNPAAGQDIWFVLNHNWVRDPLERRFRSRETSAAAKVRFTFRY